MEFASKMIEREVESKMRQHCYITNIEGESNLLKIRCFGFEVVESETMDVNYICEVDDIYIYIYMV